MHNIDLEYNKSVLRVQCSTSIKFPFTVAENTYVREKLTETFLYCTKAINNKNKQVLTVFIYNAVKP